VAVLERSHYDRMRIGEVLPPVVRAPLVELGVWDRFVTEGHAPSPGILSAWGQDEPYDNHFVFNPHGHGWHLDRGRFDAMLALVAEETGANIRRGARVRSCLPVASRGWQVEFVSDGERDHLLATFLVDSTGRACVSARWQGAERISYDRLVGLVGYFSARSAGRERDHQTLIEAAEDGWWYSACLPDSRLAVAYMTDADLIPKGRVPVSGHWRNRLDQAPHTRSRMSGCASETGLRPVAANSYRLDLIAEDNWLAAGDAATAFDPLSSQGICHALKSGLLAARAIEDSLLGDQTALDEYARETHRSFDKYLSTRAVYYGREQRWSSSAFWRRRQDEPHAL
jgi:flavin-dependent dehydrogenase